MSKYTKYIRNVLTWIAFVAVCMDLPFSGVLSSLASDSGYGPGYVYDTDGVIVSDEPFDISREIQSVSGPQYEIADQGINYSVTQKDGQTIYIFEGKEYTAGSSFGVHKLSGYSGTETGSAMTASGTVATSKHTLAATSLLPVGTVLIITGVEGPHKDLYNGMYVVEDRGDYHVETEGWLDIFFDSYADALYVTDSGWTYAEAVIAVPVA